MITGFSHALISAMSQMVIYQLTFLFRQTSQGRFDEITLGCGAEGSHSDFVDS